MLNFKIGNSKKNADDELKQNIQNEAIANEEVIYHNGISSRREVYELTMDEKIQKLHEIAKELDPAEPEFFDTMELIRGLEQLNADYHSIDGIDNKDSIKNVCSENKDAVKRDWTPVWTFAGVALSSLTTLACVLLSTAYNEAGFLPNDAAKKIIDKGISGRM